MRKKNLKQHDAEYNDEAFDEYLHVIGANIIEFNRQMEEVE